MKPRNILLIIIIIWSLLQACTKPDLSKQDYKATMYTRVFDKYDIVTFQFKERDTSTYWIEDKYVQEQDEALKLPAYNSWGRYCDQIPFYIAHSYTVKGYKPIIPDAITYVPHTVIDTLRLQ